ncbi:hypothetical protein HDU76_002426 [Blyttiomyces sp. JEL0837]|nr:hypothetical protein HDU76_002426 [Blyttiomyces sp. JEL0837]
MMLPGDDKGKSPAWMFDAKVDQGTPQNDGSPNAVSDEGSVNAQGDSFGSQLQLPQLPVEDFPLYTNGWPQFNYTPLPMLEYDVANAIRDMAYGKPITDFSPEMQLSQQRPIQTYGSSNFFIPAMAPICSYEIPVPVPELRKESFDAVSDVAGSENVSNEEAALVQDGLQVASGEVAMDRVENDAVMDTAVDGVEGQVVANDALMNLDDNNSQGGSLDSQLAFHISGNNNNETLANLQGGSCDSQLPVPDLAIYNEEVQAYNEFLLGLSEDVKNAIDGIVCGQRLEDFPDDIQTIINQVFNNLPKVTVDNTQLAVPTSQNILDTQQNVQAAAPEAQIQSNDVANYSGEMQQLDPANLPPPVLMALARISMGERLENFPDYIQRIWFDLNAGGNFDWQFPVATNENVIEIQQSIQAPAFDPQLSVQNLPRNDVVGQQVVTPPVKLPQELMDAFEGLKEFSADNAQMLSENLKGGSVDTQISFQAYANNNLNTFQSLQGESQLSGQNVANEVDVMQEIVDCLSSLNLSPNLMAANAGDQGQSVPEGSVANVPNAFSHDVNFEFSLQTPEIVQDEVQGWLHNDCVPNDANTAMGDPDANGSVSDDETELMMLRTQYQQDQAFINGLFQSVVAKDDLIFEKNQTINQLQEMLRQLDGKTVSHESVSSQVSVGQDPSEDNLRTIDEVVVERADLQTETTCIGDQIVELQLRLEAALQTIEENNETIKSTSHRLTDLVEDVSTKEATIKQLQQTNAELVEKSAAEKVETEKVVKGHTERISKLTKELATKDELIKKLEAAHAELTKSKPAAPPSLPSQPQAPQPPKSSLQDAKKKYTPPRKTRKAEAQAPEVSQQTAASLTEFKAKATSLEVKLNESQRELKEAVDRAQELERKLGVEKNLARALRQEVDSANESIHKLKVQFEAANDETNDLRLHVSGLDKKFEDTEKAFKEQLETSKQEVDLLHLQILEMEKIRGDEVLACALAEGLTEDMQSPIVPPRVHDEVVPPPLMTNADREARLNWCVNRLKQRKTLYDNDYEALIQQHINAGCSVSQPQLPYIEVAKRAAGGAVKSSSGSKGMRGCGAKGELKSAKTGNAKADAEGKVQSAQSAGVGGKSISKKVGAGGIKTGLKAGKTERTEVNIKTEVNSATSSGVSAKSNLKNVGAVGGGAVSKGAKSTKVSGGDRVIGGSGGSGRKMLWRH